MADFSSVVVIGRLVRDPDLKYVSSGAPVCNFAVATSRRWTKDDGQRVEETTFLEVTAWKRLAEVCKQFLKKGREVLVMGTLHQDRWTDKTTQQPRSKIKVVASTVQFLGKRDEETEEPAGPSGAAEAPEPSES